MPSTVVLTPELLVFQHLKSLNYSDKLLERFCQEVKFSPPEKDQKCEVSLSEVLQHYKNVTQESSNKKRKAAEDNGYEDAEEEEFGANKKTKKPKFGGGYCFNCGKYGHFFRKGRKCPEPKICYNCKKPGHVSKECTETVGANSRLSCNNCNTIGHMGRNCDKPRVERSGFGRIPKII